MDGTFRCLVSLTASGKILVDIVIVETNETIRMPLNVFQARDLAKALTKTAAASEKMKAVKERAGRN